MVSEIAIILKFFFFDSRFPSKYHVGTSTCHYQTNIYLRQKKINKTFCRNDAFDIKTFDSEHLEKLAEYYCYFFTYSFKCRSFVECEKIAFDRPRLRKYGDPDSLNSHRPLHNTSFLSKVIQYACIQ